MLDPVPGTAPHILALQIKSCNFIWPSFVPRKGNLAARNPARLNRLRPLRLTRVARRLLDLWCQCIRRPAVALCLEAVISLVQGGKSIHPIFTACVSRAEIDVGLHLELCFLGMVNLGCAPAEQREDRQKSFIQCLFQLSCRAKRLMAGGGFRKRKFTRRRAGFI